MIKIPYLLLGFALFLIGVCFPYSVSNIFVIPFSLIGFMLVLIGSFIISRPMASEYSTGPGYFITGIPILVLSYFGAIPIIVNTFQTDLFLAWIVRFCGCLVGGSITWYSIKK